MFRDDRARLHVGCIYFAPVRASALVAVLSLSLLVPELARPAALEPPSTGGMVALHRILSRLDTHRRVLVIGAHPDDEDTALLALVSRGMGGEAAYLSLSRGEGGQNLIGAELGEELGLVRSQELLAARGIDGARQFFTRAYDFGYTRSFDETNERWPPEAILEDTVRVVRRFKPQIVVSIFSTGSDAGHGQHQAAGVAAHEAFTAAADVARFPGLSEQGLPPWQPAALYRSTFFRPTPQSLTLPTGAIDPASGKTYFQLAMASRSMHRSQDMGVLQDPGPRATRVEWVAGVRSEATAGEVAPAEGAGEGGLRDFQPRAAGAQRATVARGDLFAGVDTRLRAIADVLAPGPERDALAAALDRVAAEVAQLREELLTSRPETAVRSLRAVVTVLEEASRRLESAALPDHDREVAGDLLGEKLELAREALAIASGWVLDAYTDSPALVAGESATVRATFYNSGSEAARVTPALHATGGWMAPAGEPRDVAPGALESWDLELAVPSGAAATVPYFLAAPRQGDLYDWSRVPPEVRGEPFGPAAVVAAFAVEAGEVRFGLEREVVHRFRDQAIGERRRPLRVVPPLEVTVTPERVLWPRSARQVERTLRVALRKQAPGAVGGRVEVEVPPGWPAIAPVPFRLEASRDFRVLEVRLRHGEAAAGASGTPRDGTPGRRGAADTAAAGSAGARSPGHGSPADRAAATGGAGDDGVARVVVKAVLESGEVIDGAVPLVEYPHLRAVPSPRLAAIEVRTLVLDLPPLASVGYVRGASDRVPESLLEVGLPLRLLSGEQILDLGEEGLERFDAIVLGSRAYEADPRLGEAHQRLLDYVRGGGLLVVQYQQYDFVERGFAPYELTIGRPHDRITDETSPVEVLAPDHPALRRPHRIGDADWEGWVQERGLYFARTWDAEYQPLVRFTDPGMPPQDGGLLVAKVGQGTYVYTGLAFFRQLPAGVPGAFRLFVNLLAL
ncbi:MAG TPA: PIG-L family deacetylase [Thermoanaerobaculia bacterium]|nr:PIG-L family deacetylase [Thermoanaerobaculia bacterium]